MAQGLRTSNMTVPAGKTRKLTLRGVFFYLKETSFPMTVALRQNDIGDKSGLVFENEMRKGEKIYAATEFDKVEITNETADDVEIQFVTGYGDFARELPERVSAADFRRTTQHVFVAADTPELVIAREEFRKRVTLTVPFTDQNAGTLWTIAESEAQLLAGIGHEMVRGSAITLEDKDAVWAMCDADSEFLIAIEEVYND